MKDLAQIEKQISVWLKVLMNPTNCQFSEPVNSEGNPPAEGEFWFWKKIDCETNETGLTTIQNEDYTAYISSKINLADIFIMGFLIILLGAMIFKWIREFIYPKIVKYQKTI